MTAEEKKLLAERRAGFDEFYEEMMPVLTEFAEDLKLPEPAMIVAQPDHYLTAIAEFVRPPSIEKEEDRIWITTRLGYFIGEVLIQRLGGSWFLNEQPESRYFLRYVVGEFDDGTRPNAMVDPFEAADGFIANPPGRDLRQFIGEIEAACRQ